MLKSGVKLEKKLEIMNKSSKYDSAVSIVKRLKDNGHEAYFVGGYVRDKLLGIVNEETDIDIATGCPIQEIPKVFKDFKHEYVGMRFGVCVVKIKAEKGYYKFDLATFRWDGFYEDGRRPSEIKIKAVSVEEDSKRRDFTINAMFYDPLTDKVLDFVGGQKDLKDKIIRAVGDPKERFKEDKLRMIRAVRLSYQLKFKIEEKTEQAIIDLRNELLPAVSYERIWQEMEKANKYSDYDYNMSFIRDLYNLGLIEQFMPEAKRWNAIWWEGFEDDDQALPRKTPLLIRIMVMLGTFEKDKVYEITQRFNLPFPKRLWGSRTNE
jgi:poly(A) polymerase